MVRDPRAQLASMLRSKPTWLHIISVFKDYCDQVLDDLTMVDELPRSRYAVIGGVIIPGPDPYLGFNFDIWNLDSSLLSVIRYRYNQ